MNNNAPMNNNAGNNTSVDLNALLNANNSVQNNNGLNKYQMPEMPGSMFGEQTTNEILASIAKNNISQLNELNENAEKETKSRSKSI